ncbi:MAG: hypothetical protein QGH83_14550 [Candidatus Pacebacteria bacterium]|jgi:hypothetical protein|nr:hypothetical protein [Candidatus Paceibacterota bacterium]
MANPNIVNVTSIYGESIAQAMTTTLDAVIMTVSSDVVLKVNSITATNTHASNATAFSLSVTKAAFTSAGVADGDDNAGTFSIASTINIPSDDLLVVLDKPFYLMEGDVLKGGADPATCDLFISYEVINDA